MLRNENSHNNVTEAMFALLRLRTVFIVVVGGTHRRRAVWRGMHLCGTQVCSGVRTRLSIVRFLREESVRGQIGTVQIRFAWPQV